MYTSFLSFDPHGKQVTKQLLAEGSSIGMIANGSRPLPIEVSSNQSYFLYSSNHLFVK